MSKLSFRARALDPSKPMPIYLAEELPDLQEYSAINRAVPQMPSGMEKEEESVSIFVSFLTIWFGFPPFCLSPIFSSSLDCLLLTFSRNTRDETTGMYVSFGWGLFSLHFLFCDDNDDVDKDLGVKSRSFSYFPSFPGFSLLIYRKDFLLFLYFHGILFRGLDFLGIFFLPKKK